MSQNSSTQTDTQSVKVQPQYSAAQFQRFVGLAGTDRVFALYQVDGVDTRVYVSGLKADAFKDEAFAAVPHTQHLGRCVHYANPDGSDYHLWFDGRDTVEF